MSDPGGAGWSPRRARAAPRAIRGGADRVGSADGAAPPPRAAQCHLPFTICQPGTRCAPARAPPRPVPEPAARHAAAARALTWRDAGLRSSTSATRHNPAIGAFYQRLLRAGKAKKVALTACMHKLLLILNAIVHAGTPWRQPAAVVGALTLKTIALTSGSAPGVAGRSGSVPATASSAPGSTDEARRLERGRYDRGGNVVG